MTPRFLAPSLLAVVTILSPVAARAEDVSEIFLDHKETFVRAGTKQGLEKGSEVVVVGKPNASGARAKLGTAVVMDVFPAMSRLSLDKASAAAKGDRYVVVPSSAPAVVIAEKVAEKPAEKPVPVAKAAPEKPEDLDRTPNFHKPENDGYEQAKPPEKKLKGRASSIGFGPVRRIRLQNENAFAWTKCELRLANNKHYLMDHLGAGEDDGIALPRFVQDGTERDVEINNVTVKCAEGSATFTFGL
jgi:hypothetical protein